MVGFDLIVLIQRLGKDDQRIPDEQMRNMVRQPIVDPSVHQLLLELGVKGGVDVVVLGSVHRVFGDVERDAVVTGLRHAEARFLQRLRTNVSAVSRP